jgi:hypothetical protein
MQKMDHCIVFQEKHHFSAENRQKSLKISETSEQNSVPEFSKSVQS